MVWFRSGTHGPEGGTSPLKIRVAPNRSGKVGVAFMEEFMGGAGESMRSAGWAASFHAAQAAGTSIADHEFVFRTGGRSDGSSASMLSAAATLAALLDVPVRQDSTMTGTINPDGTCGPVGGIEHKMKGAKEAGIKRFGIPMGLRQQVNRETDDTLDLFDHARELGLEVKEIPDLATAYEWMTGQKLPQRTEVGEATL